MLPKTVIAIAARQPPQTKTGARQPTGTTHSQLRENHDRFGGSCMAQS